MSQYGIVVENKTYVFGWDQPMLTFFLQVHDSNYPEDDNPVVWRGTSLRSMYEVEDLVRAAKENGLDINHDMQVKLFSDKDNGV